MSSHPESIQWCHMGPKERLPRFGCLSTNWQQTHQRVSDTQGANEEDIIVTAGWARGLTNIYNALDAATTLGYSDTGRVRSKNILDHCWEFLIDGGIAADGYRILAVFEAGGGAPRVEFECPPLFRIVTLVPDRFFYGRRRGDALFYIQEIPYRTGMRNDMERDELMRPIAHRR